MNKKITTVTIGISAFNEEANIKYLLNDLLNQKQEGYVLKEIIVISDGSRDNTVKNVKELQHKQIRIITHKSSKGKALRQNEIAREAKGEIIVIIDADVKLRSNNFIKQLITPIIKDPMIGIAGSKVYPLQPSNFFERVLYFSVKLKQQIYEEINKGNNIYLCHGRARAFSKKFLSEINWPPVFGEDAYSYLFCVSKGFRFKYVNNAVIYYKLPDNLRDHLKQSVRFLTLKESLSDYFDKDFMKGELHILNLSTFSKIIKSSAGDPLMFASYVFTLCYTRYFPHRTFNLIPNWKQSESTKILVKV